MQQTNATAIVCANQFSNFWDFKLVLDKPQDVNAL